MSVIGKLGKWLTGLIAVILLLLVGVITLVVFSDANYLKPHIEEQLAQRGVYTQFAGDLSWSLYPVTGITTRDLRLFNHNNKQQTALLASLDKLSLQIDLRALLFQRAIAINAVVLDAPMINYQVDVRGMSNWQPVLDSVLRSPAPPGETSLPDNEKPTNFRISQLIINNLRVQYSDKQAGSALELHEAQLRVSNINLQGDAIALQSEGEIIVAPYPAISYTLSGSFRQPSDSELQLHQLEFGLRASQARFGGSGELAVSLDEPQSTQLDFKLSRFDPRPWFNTLQLSVPEMANANALSQVSASGTLALKPEKIELSALKLQMDDSTIVGNLSLTPRNKLPPKIDAQFDISKINLDDYLPPSREPNDDVESSATPLDLSFLEQQNSKIKLRVAEAQIYKQKLYKIDSVIQAKHNTLKLDLKQAAVYRGNTALQAEISNSSPGASFTMAINASAIDVFDALTSLELYDQLKGLVNLQINASSKGMTGEELQQRMRADVEVDAPEILFTALNVEQRYCDALAKLENKSKITNWPPHTTIAPFQAKLDYSQEAVNIKSLQALIQGMQTTANGRFVPDSGEFYVPLDLAFKDFTAAQKDCPLLNAKWRSQKIPLLCKGTLNKLGTDICAPDYKRLSDKLEDRYKQEKDKLEEKAEARAREIRQEARDEAKKAGEKAEQRAKESREEAKDKVDEEAKKLLDDMVGEKKAEELEDKLKNLLNRK